MPPKGDSSRTAGRRQASRRRVLPPSALDETSLYTLGNESAKSGDGASDMDEQRYEQRYEQWAAPLRSRPGVVRALRVLNRGIVGVFYAAYAVLLGWACATDPWKLAPLSGVVALGFAAVSAYRSCLNAPRPYERCAISPLIVLLVAAGALAVCRVLGGVHFPRDVVAGAFIGSATGALAAFLAALL